MQARWRVGLLVRQPASLAAAASIIAAHFSPIMMVGALVLPLVSVGMIEASAIRRPCHALHAQFEIDHGARVGARLAGADRVIGRLGVVAYPFEQFGVGLRDGRRGRSPRRSLP